ncbi:hypothetical protein Tco_1052157, partial [Tanacetum coccineum]
EMVPTSVAGSRFSAASSTYVQKFHVFKSRLRKIGCCRKVHFQSSRYVVPTGRVVVPAGRYIVPAGKVILIVSTGRLSLVPTGRVLSPGKRRPYDHDGFELVEEEYLLGNGVRLFLGVRSLVVIADLFGDGERIHKEKLDGVTSKVLHGVKFEVEPLGDHTFEVEPQGNVEALLDKAKENYFGMECQRSSDNTLRLLQSGFYNEKFGTDFVGRHSYCSLRVVYLKDSDVVKDGSGHSGISVGSHDIIGEAKFQHVGDFSATGAGYMTLIEAVKEAIWLNGFSIESGAKLRSVAGIVTGALTKAVPGLRFQHWYEFLSIGIG